MDPIRKIYMSHTFYMIDDTKRKDAIIVLVI